MNESQVVFEELYIPPCPNERHKVEELVTVALKNGFQYLKCPGITPAEIIAKPRQFIVLTNYQGELTLEIKPVNRVLSNISNDLKLCSPQRAINWVLEKTQK